MTRTRYVLLVSLLGAVTALPPLSVDATLPAMPATADGLGTDAGQVQLSLAAYTFGAALGQLLIGALSDRFGRRAVLRAVLVLFVAASLGCAFAGSIEMLIGFRFLHGITTAVGRVLPRAMARDLYDREEAARMLSYMMMFGGMAPVVAPLVGGALSAVYGWRAVFGFIAAYGGFVMILAWLFLRETLPTTRRMPLHPRTTARNLWAVLRNRVFMSYAACVCVLAGGLFAFLSASSAVLIRGFGETPQQFGFDFATVMIAGVMFNFTAGWLVVRLGLDRLLGLGAALAAVAGVGMAGLAWAGVASVWAVIGPMFIYMIAYTFVVSAASAGALSPFPRLAGSAASCLGFLQTASAATVTGVVSLMGDGTARPMAGTIALMGLLLLLAYLLLVRRLPATKHG